MEFTVVLPQDLPPLADDTLPEVEPVQEIDPLMPENIPLVKDAVLVKKKPVKKPVKKPEKKPVKKPVKKPFERGKRIKDKPVKKQPDFSKLKPVTLKDVKPLTRDQIKKALLSGAKPGSRNTLPESEVSRCISLVHRAMYNSWVQPGSAEAGSRAVLLDIRIDKGGRIVSYRIRQSSGSRICDQSVLRAAANVRQIRGLSSGFLKKYEIMTIEFIVSD